MRSKTDKNIEFVPEEEVEEEEEKFDEEIDSLGLDDY